MEVYFGPQFALAHHEHDMEYGRWDNYTQIWKCRFPGCEHEERSYIECY